MRVLKLNEDFLYKPVEWERDEQYKKAKAILNALSVTNDAVERGVKLADFQQTAKKEDRFQDILQVVENSRHSLSDQRKRKNCFQKLVPSALISFRQTVSIVLLIQHILTTSIFPHLLFFVPYCYSIKIRAKSNVQNCKQQISRIVYCTEIFNSPR